MLRAIKPVIRASSRPLMPLARPLVPLARVPLRKIYAHNIHDEEDLANFADHKKYMWQPHVRERSYRYSLIFLFTCCAIAIRNRMASVDECDFVAGPEDYWGGPLPAEDKKHH